MTPFKYLKTFESFDSIQDTENMAVVDYTQIADQITALIRKYNFRIAKEDSINFTIVKEFTPNSGIEFNQIQEQAEEIMQLVPTTTGHSILWGSNTTNKDKSNALRNGYFKMNKSGVSKKLLKLLIFYKLPD